MFGQRGKAWQTSVAVEISRAWLHLAVVERRVGTGETRRRHRSVAWRHDSRSLLSEQGVRELGAGLARLVADEHLAGHPINVALSGDYGFTRVVTGQPDHVHREMEETKLRAQHYLRLGHGPKAMATAWSAIDTRHHHALLAVTNERTLRSLLDAAELARVEIGRVEPSFVALSRALGLGQCDAAEPVLVINVGDRSVESGISFRGRLLLDYRPTGRDDMADVADIVASHMGRLRKFFNRHFGYVTARLARIYLCGPDEGVAMLRAGFARHSELVVDTLTPAMIDARFADAQHGAAPTEAPLSGTALPGAVYNAALGTCLLAEHPDLAAASPDLMAPIYLAHQERLLPAACKTLWPAAAAMLLTAGLLGWSLAEHYRGAAIRREIAALEPTRAQVFRLRSELTRADTKAQYLREIAGHTAPPPRARLLTTIAQCLPGEVWLDRVEIDGAGKATLTGASFGEDPVFEFVRWLSAAPGLRQVQLEGTTVARLAEGAVTKFEVKCEIVVDNVPTGDDEKSHGSNSQAISDNPLPPTHRHNPIFDGGLDGGLVRGR